MEERTMMSKLHFSYLFICIVLCLILLPDHLLVADQIPAYASVDSKYSNLIQVLHCPKDKATYGEFKDYGHWEGGTWCGQTGKAGYWVWVAPNWYVWKNKHED
jgi:hypothetical protein